MAPGGAPCARRQCGGVLLLAAMSGLSVIPPEASTAAVVVTAPSAHGARVRPAGGEAGAAQPPSTRPPVRGAGFAGGVGVAELAEPVAAALPVTAPVPAVLPAVVKNIAPGGASSTTSGSGAIQPAWQATLASYHDWNVTTMRRIAWCESRNESGAVDPVAIDGAHATGLFQILVFLPGGAVVPGSTNPIVNVEQAHAKWLAQGYGAWASSKTCWAGAGGVG